MSDEAVECRDQLRWAQAWLMILIGVLAIVLAAL